MNAWRWLGLSVFLITAVSLIGITDFTASATEKKTPTDPKKTAEEPKKTPVDPKKTTEEPKKTAEEPKKKTEEVKKVDPPKAGAWEFKAFEKKGNVLYQKQYTKTVQKMKVMGQEVVQEQTQTFLIEWTALEPDKDNFIVNQKIKGVDMLISIGGNKIAYDSRAANKQKNPMTDFFEQLTKQELKFTIKKDLSEVKSIEGRDAFIKGLSDINPQMMQLLKAILSEKALTKMAEPTWYAFPPGGSVPASKTWSRKSDLDLGPIGKYDTNFDFTVTKTEGTKEHIGIKTKLTYTAPTEKAGLPFIIHEAKLTANDGTGSTIFDSKMGRFDSTELTMKLTGTLTIEVGSMKTTVELTQDQTSRSDTYDALPDDWKAK